MSLLSSTSSYEPTQDWKCRHFVAPTLMVHLDTSLCNQGAKITEKMSLRGLGQALHPVCSSGISLCGVWAFGTTKRRIKDHHFYGLEEIHRAIQEVWSQFTLEDFPNGFKSPMERLTWAIVTNREYCHQKSCLESHLI
jgi:hypothetical protein